MAGFFKSSKLQSITGPQRSCIECGLGSNCNAPKMKPHGRGEKGIFILGGSPTIRADKKGIPIEGPEQRLLISLFHKHGISLERDCVMMNTVNCCCGVDKKRRAIEPNSTQIEACRRVIQTEYRRFKPKLIFLLGGQATNSHWGHRWKGEIKGIAHWRGWDIPDHHFNTWTAPVYHPEYILRETTQDVAQVILKNDIEKGLSLLHEPLPEKIDEDSVKIYMKESQALDYLKDLWKNPPEYLCFDYETTGLKPHHPGHQIVCAGIATERDTATAFFLTPKVEYFLKKILSESPSKKIAQNMKFEETWTRVILGRKVKNWYFDPMLASHVLDNRRGITGLKYQAFVQFGITDYDSHIRKYLESNGKDSNGFNRIHKAPKRDLLIYCALDALIEFRLAMKQIAEIGLKDIVIC